MGSIQSIEPTPSPSATPSLVASAAISTSVTSSDSPLNRNIEDLHKMSSVETSSQGSGTQDNSKDKMTSKCPMKYSNGEGGGYKNYLGGFLQGNKPHPHPNRNVGTSPPTNSSVDHSSVHTTTNQTTTQHTSGEPSLVTTATKPAGGCPVKRNQSDPIHRPQQQIQYNVYSQPIDPSNHMPVVANQLPSPLQKEPLSTQRVSSSIPKGGANQGETWLYPSPQMFYNSLIRKNKLADTQETDVEAVVAIHNGINEKTWSKILQWEQVLHPTVHNKSSTDATRVYTSETIDDDNASPKLLKFMGRPSDLSPKARFKHLVFGYPLPFDRHDWTIVRSDGTEVRYVIDYYYDESRTSDTMKQNSMATASNQQGEAFQSILLDVRPAMDSVTHILDRLVKMPFARYIENSTSFQPLPLLPTADLKKQVGDSKIVWENIQSSVRSKPHLSELTDSQNHHNPHKNETSYHPQDLYVQEEPASHPTMTQTEASTLLKSFSNMLQSCQNAQRVLDKCQGETECTKASLALTMCMGKVLCPLQHDTVTRSVNEDTFDKSDEKSVTTYHARVDTALENLATCVQLKSQQIAYAKRNYPELSPK